MDTMIAALDLDGCPDQSADAEAVLAWACARFAPRIGLTASFGGAAGLVLAHMIATRHPQIPIYVIDTDFLFAETYALIEQFEARYGVAVVRVRPRLTPAAQAATHGAELWRRDPDACCLLRKVEPMERLLLGLDAWITGIRREQSPTRRAASAIEVHERGERRIVKLNPLAAWTNKEVWDYIFANDVPYNPLLDRGYRSIGCTHCTVVSCGEDERSGRWAGHEKTECGLHTFTRPLGPDQMAPA